MRILALDLGKRRTGMALFDSASQTIVALDSLQSSNSDDSSLHSFIVDEVKKRRITHIAVGMPLLPSGDEGEQAQWVSMIVEAIRDLTHLPIITIDERYTSMDALSKHNADAKAACAIADIAAAKLLQHKKV